MTLEKLIISLQEYIISFPEDRDTTKKTIEWIEKYREFAFVKANFEGHITGSMIITNPERTKVLLMLHKKFQRWQQFGGHCDGETDVRSVAIREFHEESGILLEPEISPGICHVDIYDVSPRTNSSGRFEPGHDHLDILYLGIIPEDTPFIRQESEVDDIRWFDIEGIEAYVGDDVLTRIKRIRQLR